MRVTQVYLETHTRRQHCSLPLRCHQPSGSSSITWFHKLTGTHNESWPDLEKTAAPWKIWKIKCILLLLLRLPVFGFCTWCCLANEGSHNHTFVLLRYVCKCYPQGAGRSLALRAHSQDVFGFLEEPLWYPWHGLEGCRQMVLCEGAGGACAPGHSATVCPQHSHTGAFIQCHIHAPETSHRMSLAQPGFVQSCLGTSCGNFIACYKIPSWSILSSH